MRLPKALVDALGLKAGDEIDIVGAEEGRLLVVKDGRREAAISRMKARRFKLPPDYLFSREDANDRG